MIVARERYPGLEWGFGAQSRYWAPSETQYELLKSIFSDVAQTIGAQNPIDADSALYDSLLADWTGGLLSEEEANMLFYCLLGEHDSDGTCCLLLQAWMQ